VVHGTRLSQAQRCAVSILDVDVGGWGTVLSSYAAVWTDTAWFNLAPDQVCELPSPSTGRCSKYGASALMESRGAAPNGPRPRRPARALRSDVGAERVGVGAPGSGTAGAQSALRRCVDGPVLWRALQLDEICEELFGRSREAAPRPVMVAVEVLGRLCELETIRQNE
jgi:hypothetical protein